MMNDAPSTAQPPSRNLRGRSLAIRAGLAISVVVAVFFGVLARLADLSEAGHQAASLGGIAIATLGVLAIVSVVAYAFALLSLGESWQQRALASPRATRESPGGGCRVSTRIYSPSWNRVRWAPMDGPGASLACPSRCEQSADTGRARESGTPDPQRGAQDAQY